MFPHENHKQWTVWPQAPQHIINSGNGVLPGWNSLPKWRQSRQRVFSTAGEVHRPIIGCFHMHFNLNSLLRPPDSVCLLHSKAPSWVWVLHTNLYTNEIIASFNVTSCCTLSTTKTLYEKQVLIAIKKELIVVLVEICSQKERQMTGK